MEPRYLTKSRWKLGLECPTKLYYTKNDLYFDGKLKDDFLQALAEGGFQVGELAKLEYPGGVNIDELDYEIALAKTNELLAQPDVIIYEAAFRSENLFVRTDLLVKRGDRVEVIEVKAKSFDPGKDKLISNKGFLITKWEPYLYDAAFQHHVVKQAHPGLQVSTSLLLIDKTKKTTVDGLNQKFFLFKKDGRKQVKVNGPVDREALGESIFTKQNIDAIIEKIYNGTEKAKKDSQSFEEKINFFSTHYAINKRLESPLTARCKTCEFRLDTVSDDPGLLSGFHECWKEKFDPLKPSILDIWYYMEKDERIREGTYFQEQVDPASFQIDEEGEAGPGLSRKERQALQVQKSRDKDTSHYIDIPSLCDLQKTWRFPYHFIDFETTAVAIPFTRGRRPYEPVAFQFSHHILFEDGKIEHRGQWISEATGKFPSFDFVRALKKELSDDEGTIFRYALHENTILNVIHGQLTASDEPDRLDLCEWIKTITHSGKDSVEKWAGARDMVDLKEVVEKFYYNPLTNGSISIKQVMPAILSSCVYLQEKYGKPVYRGLNFEDWQWVRYDAAGRVIDPYELLPPVFAGVENRSLDALLDEEAGIADGGAAMTAYARMQFTEMGDEERRRVRDALLKYCELDTFAMVLVWEGLAHWTGEKC